MNFWTPKNIKSVNEELKDIIAEFGDKHGLDIQIGELTFNGTQYDGQGNIAKIKNVPNSGTLNVKSGVVMRPRVDYEFTKDELSAWKRFRVSVAMRNAAERNKLDLDNITAIALGDEFRFNPFECKNVFDRYNSSILSKVLKDYNFNSDNLPEGAKIVIRLVGINKKKSATPIILEHSIVDVNGKKLDAVPENSWYSKSRINFEGECKGRDFLQIDISKFMELFDNNYLTDLKLQKLGL